MESFCKLLIIIIQGWPWDWVMVVIIGGGNILHYDIQVHLQRTDISASGSFLSFLAPERSLAPVEPMKIPQTNPFFPIHTTLLYSCNNITGLTRKPGICVQHINLLANVYACRNHVQVLKVRWGQLTIQCLSYYTVYRCLAGCRYSRCSKSPQTALNMG